MSRASGNTWDSYLYDNKISFVSQFGKDVVKLLNPQPGEQILDLGCGTGDLTYEIARTGADPCGIDISSSMIEKARQKYPWISFGVESGETFRTTKSFDAVFSNAALHWMKQADKVVESVWIALRPGGRFVAEFGGKGNVETMIRGISTVLAEYGISASKENPWYFPSIGEYSSLLERQGFHMIYAVHFDRPTSLEDGENGLKHWLDMFANDFFFELSPHLRSVIYKELMEQVKPALFKNGTWTMDYKRIQIMAVKG